MNNDFSLKYEDPYSQIHWKTDGIEMEREPTCPLCSQRLSDLDETYFVGCPMCYKVFENEVLKLAQSYHGTTQHFGKTPKKELSKSNINKELFELSQQEKKAVSNRDYVLAEEIKRKIETLRGGE